MGQNSGPPMKKRKGAVDGTYIISTTVHFEDQKPYGWHEKKFIRYQSDEAFWKTVKPEDWYDNQLKYWQNATKDYKGMLGGHLEVDEVDSKTSIEFLSSIFTERSRKCAIDCGAGVGRVTKHVLGQIFDKVDLVEYNEEFLEVAKEQMGEESYFRNVYASSLHDFHFPENSSYNLIYAQWVLECLTDDDLISFLQRCKKHVSSDGWIVIKENMSCSHYFNVNGNSCVRSRQYWETILEQCGLEVAHEQRQEGLPQGFFPVWMFALKSKS